MRYPRIATPFLVGVIAVIAYLDYRTGFMLSLFPLYLVPVLVVAWYDKRSTSVAVSLLAAALVIIKDAAIHRSQSFYYYSDETIKAALLVLIAYGTWEIRHLLREKERTNQELKQALSEIKELREMIPICAWCHSIRNDKGFYERIEVYLSQITGARFTHGICPDCLRKHYADLGEPPEEHEGEQKPGKTK